MIRSELVQRMSEAHPHLKHRDVEDVVAVILDETVETLATGNRVELRGFGAFSVKRRPARIARNPKTGEKVPVGEKFVPAFRTGKFLHNNLNPGNTD